MALNNFFGPADTMGGRKFKLGRTRKNEEIKKQKANKKPLGRPRKQKKVFINNAC